MQLKGVRKEFRERIDQLRESGTSTNTVATYQSAERYFQGWLRFAKGRESIRYPITKAYVMDFVLTHLEGLPHDIDQQMVAARLKSRLGRHKVNTIRAKLIALGYIHKAKGLENPCRSAAINDCLRLAKQAESKKGVVIKRSKAITKNILDRMLRTINTRTVVGKRDRALMEFGFYTGGRRRSEIARAEVRFLSPRSAGAYEYRLHRSKTDQTGQGALKILRARHARGLTAWINSAGIEDGFLFRKISITNKISEKRLSGADVNRVVKRYIERIRENPSDYSAHGLRRGFITQCGRDGVPLGDVMQVTGHRDIRTVMTYYEEGAIHRNPATRI